MKNLLRLKTQTPNNEEFQTLVEGKGFKLEQIHSYSHPTPKGEWYDQEQSEWVSLVQGTATLEWDDQTTTDLLNGDHLVIPPHKRHRVKQVSQDAVWLALFY